MDKKARLVLAKRVKELREKRGYTQEKLASLTGIDYKYIQRIEGKTPPSIRVDTIQKLAEALKAEYADLLKK